MNPTELQSAVIKKPKLQQGLWQDGWYRFAHHSKSPNFGVRPDGARVDLLVLHSISLPPGNYGGDEVRQLFTNQLDWDSHCYFQRIKNIQVSAHFYIQRNGQLWQFVSTEKRAWHAGTSSYRGRDNCNDYSIGIELEGLEGEVFEEAQYESLAALCSAIGQHLPNLHVAGHEHIAPGRKTDPGAGFDWSRLTKMLAWDPQVFP